MFYNTNNTCYKKKNKVGHVQQQLCLYYYFQAVPSPDTKWLMRKAAKWSKKAVANLKTAVVEQSGEEEEEAEEEEQQQA
jgi:hypothetical protein